MALFDNLAKTLADAAAKAAEASKSIDAKEIQKNLTNAVNDTVSKVKDTAGAIDPKDIPGSLTKMASDAGQAIVKHNNDRKESQASAKEVLRSAQVKQNYVTVHDAMKVIYLLMFSDRDFTEEEKQNFDYDMMIFFSPTGVKALKKNFPEFVQGDIKIAAFGPATAKEVEAQGLRLDLMAPNKDYPSMTGALKAFLEKNKK